MQWEIPIPNSFFKGKRFNPDLMKGASPGSNCAMSESGWSNGQIFKEYLENQKEQIRQQTTNFDTILWSFITLFFCIDRLGKLTTLLNLFYQLTPHIRCNHWTYLFLDLSKTFITVSAHHS